MNRAICYRSRRSRTRKCLSSGTLRLDARASVTSQRHFAPVHRALIGVPPIRQSQSGPPTRGPTAAEILMSRLDSACNIMHNTNIVLRENIIREVQRQELSVAELTRRCDGRICRRALIYYLDGEHDLSSERVDVLLKVLGLKVVRRPNRGKAPRRHSR